ncbi:MAG: hypothetical protein ACI837_003354 [Crocinitomicaceae bacterium]|jgi:hypothetical protein
MFIIKPIEITLAVSNGSYNITKEKINYKGSVFKEYKGSHVMLSKTPADVETIWSNTFSTKEFMHELKALGNLCTLGFDAIYSPEDEFPEEWKIVE